MRSGTDAGPQVLVTGRAASGALPATAEQGQLLSAGELPRQAWDHQLRTMDVCLTETWQRLLEREYNQTAPLNALVLQSGWVWIWL